MATLLNIQSLNLDMDITATSLSHGVGGSYTKWQREPPAHRVYEIETPDGKLTLEVYAENSAMDPEDHPTITKIEDATSFASDLSWDDTDDTTKEAVREHISELVKDDEWFQD